MNKRNPEGYSDPTAYAALSKMEREEKQIRKFRKFKAALNQICERFGYRLEGQISVIDKKTGQTHKL